MIVLDASVAVKLVSREPGHEAALARIIVESDRIAPDWIRIEVANALSRKVRSGVSVPYLDDAFALATQLDYAVYDCLYLALAVARNGIVLTADRGLVSAAKRHGFGPDVEHVA